MFWCESLSLSYLVFVELLGCLDSYISSNFGIWGPLFLQISFLLISLAFFLGLPLCLCWHAWWYPTCPLGSVHLSSFFFFCSLEPIFKFSIVFPACWNLLNCSSEFFVFVFQNFYLFLCLFVCFLKHLYWSIIALQWCVSFCFIAKWVSYTYTYIPIFPPSCVSLPPSLFLFYNLFCFIGYSLFDTVFS